MSLPLRHRMQANLNAAIKSRDAVPVSVLRTTLTAVANAEAVHPNDGEAGLTGDVERRQLSEDDIRAILPLGVTASELQRVGLAAAAELDRRAAILASYHSA